jgi:hypothetical protein
VGSGRRARARDGEGQDGWTAGRLCACVSVCVRGAREVRCV